MSTIQRLGLALFLAAVVAAAGYYWVRVQGEKPPATSVLPATPSEETATPNLVTEDETRRLEMQVAYADLERDRLLLNRQLGALNAKLWGRRLPAARAQSIQTDMMSAKSLLTNPPLLGAFLDVDGIRHERDRVQAALATLETIDSELPAGD